MIDDKWYIHKRLESVFSIFDNDNKQWATKPSLHTYDASNA